METEKLGLILESENTEIEQFIEVNYNGNMNIIDSFAISTSYSLEELNNRIDDLPENVNADWNATSGAAQILNKPDTFPPPNASPTVVGGIKARLDGTTLYITTDGTNP